MMSYAGIDLHANNSVLVVIDDQDQILYQKRLRNDLATIVAALSKFRETLQAIAVESTYNWYWLVDGLMEAGFRVHLAHVPALPQYSGLKHADDPHDAQWLAHLLRLGAAPDRLHLSESVAGAAGSAPQTQSAGSPEDDGRPQPAKPAHAVDRYQFSLKRLQQLTPEDIAALVPFPAQRLSVTSSLTVMRCLEDQIRAVEQAVRQQGQAQPAFALLQTVTGIGPTLALTILLETGDIRRFATVGQFASYCRCVSSQHLSNGKRKGTGNTKNGNKYLSWALIEAIRYDALVRRFYQRKAARSHPLVALKAVAHKLARACYHMLRDQVPYQVTRAFA